MRNKTIAISLLIAFVFGLGGCNKVTNIISKDSYKRSELFDDAYLGAQVAYFEKKFNLTPVRIENENGGIDKIVKKLQTRSYEIDGCFLMIQANLSTMSIVSISGQIYEKCALKYRDVGFSNPFNSKTTSLKSIVGDPYRNNYDPPHFLAKVWFDNKSDGSEEILIQHGPANFYINERYTLVPDENAGIGNWINMVRSKEGDNWRQIWCSTKYDLDAARTWGDAKISRFEISQGLYKPVGVCPSAKKR
jgi:hypothetical protein